MKRQEDVLPGDLNPIAVLTRNIRDAMAVAAIYAPGKTSVPPGDDPCEIAKVARKGIVRLAFEILI